MDTFDLALSIGDSCKPAFYLKKSELRTFACPMDWLVCGIKNQVKLYQNNFKNFFDNYYEDFNIKRDENYRAIRDKKYDILCMHHISASMDLKTAVLKFKKTMIRRYERLNQKLLASKSILLVSNEKISILELKESLLDFSKKYLDKKIKLISVIDSDEKKLPELYKVNDNLIIERYYIDDKYDEKNGDPKYKWAGNSQKWMEIIDKYELKKL